MVHALNSYSLFKPIDKAFARLVLGGGAMEEEALFLSYLFLATRQGHIAITVNEDLVPSFEEIDPELKEKIKRGASLFQSTPIVTREGDKFYLAKHYFLEKELLRIIQERETQDVYPKIEISHLAYDGLLEKQKEAIIKAVSSNFLLLTGGPGTGKSFTAVEIIHAIWSHLPDEERKTFEIVVGAPTGKAASHLMERLEMRLKGNEVLQHITSKTLHALLGIKKDRFALFEDEKRCLSADLVIVDESSMIDLHLMSALFSALKPHSRLILIGDRHQLPPIELGTLFADLCDLKKERVTELVVCMRSELKEIIDLSEEVKRGKMALLTSDRFRLAYKSPQENQQLILSKMLEYGFENFRVLGSVRKGPLGIEELNWLLLSEYQKRKRCFTLPIIFTQNDYRREIFNGEMGRLNYNEEGNPLSIEAKGSIGPLHHFPPFELGFCLSIHKAQGSEWDNVLVVLPETGDSFGREILYTAITRAKKQVTLLASDESLISCLKKKSKRFSGLLVS